MLFINIFLIVFSPYMAFLPMLAAGFSVFQRGGFVLRNTWNAGLFFLFMWSFFSGIANDNPVSTTASLGFLFYLFISVYIQNYYSEEDQIEKLLKKLILVSLGSAFIGILERFTTLHNEPTWWKHLFGIFPQVIFSETQRISGTFGNPNVAGAWYAVMVLVCFYFYNKSCGSKRILYGLGVAVFFSVLMMTESRGATIGLVMGLITYAYFNGHKKSMFALATLLLSGTVLMLIFPNWFPRGYNLIDSLTDRSEIWINSLNMFIHKPITGWGLLGIYYAPRDIYNYTRTYHAHNIWITLAATLGLVGLSAYVYMKYSLFQEIRQLYRQNCRLVPLLAGIQAIIIGQGLLDFTIMNPQGGIIFFGCSAIISGLAFKYNNLAVNEYYPILLRARDR